MWFVYWYANGEFREESFSSLSDADSLFDELKVQRETGENIWGIEMYKKVRG
jgi:hypothetical protein